MEKHRQSFENIPSFDLSSLLSDLSRMKHLFAQRRELKNQIQNYSKVNKVGIRLTNLIEQQKDRNASLSNLHDKKIKKCIIDYYKNNVHIVFLIIKIKDYILLTFLDVNPHMDISSNDYTLSNLMKHLLIKLQNKKKMQSVSGGAKDEYMNPELVEYYNYDNEDYSDEELLEIADVIYEMADEFFIDEKGNMYNEGFEYNEDISDSNLYDYLFNLAVREMYGDEYNDNEIEDIAYAIRTRFSPQQRDYESSISNVRGKAKKNYQKAINDLRRLHSENNMDNSNVNFEYSLQKSYKNLLSKQKLQRNLARKSEILKQRRLESQILDKQIEALIKKAQESGVVCEGFLQSMLAADEASQKEMREKNLRKESESVSGESTGASKNGDTERQRSERPTSERGASERGASERQTSERGASERGASERPTSERGTTIGASVKQSLKSENSSIAQGKPQSEKKKTVSKKSMIPFTLKSNYENFKSAFNTIKQEVGESQFSNTYDESLFTDFENTYTNEMNFDVSAQNLLVNSSQDFFISKISEQFDSISKKINEFENDIQLDLKKQKTINDIKALRKMLDIFYTILCKFSISALKYKYYSTCIDIVKKYKGSMSKYGYDKLLRQQDLIILKIYYIFNFIVSKLQSYFEKDIDKKSQRDRTVDFFSESIKESYDTDAVPELFGGNLNTDEGVQLFINELENNIIKTAEKNFMEASKNKLEVREQDASNYDSRKVAKDKINYVINLIVNELINFYKDSGSIEEQITSDTVKQYVTAHESKCKEILTLLENKMNDKLSKLKNKLKNNPQPRNNNNIQKIQSEETSNETQQQQHQQNEPQYYLNNQETQQTEYYSENNPEEEETVNESGNTFEEFNEDEFGTQNVNENENENENGNENEPQQPINN
jgi:hypothetical protein